MAGVDASSTIAPSAGPATIAAWPIPARRACARGSSESATRRAVHAATQGGSTTPIAVAAAAISGARITGRPTAATAASPTISTALAMFDAMISRRRSQRSASTPPIGPRTTTGSTRPAVVSATQVADPVRWKTNASSATL